MEKSEIIAVLGEWNPWKEELKTGFQRTWYLEKIERLHKTGQVLAISGVRRAGKSTLMKQYINKLAKIHGADSILYVNFEEPLFTSANLEFLMKTYEAYRETIYPKGKCFVFLDEVQKVMGWERFARGLHEKGAADVFVSGSTGKLLSAEYGTLLTGRHVDISVYPFGFSEFLAVRGIAEKREALLRKNETLNFLNEYARWGGFPKVALVEEKKEVLSAYFDDIISKDIIERNKVREAAKLKELAKYFFTNISSRQSFNKLGKLLNLSVNSVERFSNYFSEAHLLHFTKKFSYSLKEQVANPRKVYAIDVGLRESIAFRFSPDMGKIMENLVALQLLREGREIYYWKEKKTDYEVDILVREGNEITEAIQITAGGANERATRALKALERELSPKKITVIGWDAPQTEYNNQALWKWLLKI